MIPQVRILTEYFDMTSQIISERTFQFACRIVKLCERLWSRGFAARKTADQLFGAGTSMG